MTINRNAMEIRVGDTITIVSPNYPALAKALAAEWQAQGDIPKPDTMPLMQLAMTALDIITPKKAEIVESIAAYAESDLLCHRADKPPELKDRQHKIWQAWLDWAQQRYNVVLRTSEGVMPVSQSPQTLQRLHEAVEAYDPFYLAGLQQAVGVSGSLILGLALAEGRATAADVFSAAELDSLFQIEKWGDDPVTTARHAGVRRDLDIARQWFTLL